MAAAKNAPNFLMIRLDQMTPGARYTFVEPTPFER